MGSHNLTTYLFINKIKNISDISSASGKPTHSGDRDRFSASDMILIEILNTVVTFVKDIRSI